MIASVAKLIDWCAIQTLSRRTPPRKGQSLRLEEAVQFLTSLHFIPSESKLAEVKFDGPVEFEFPTLRPSEFAENNTAYGQLYRCGEPMAATACERS